MSYRITAVCLGNICRSPMAEAVLRQRFESIGVEDRVTVDSAGTGRWHVGGSADPRTLAALQRRGYRIDHTVRQIRPEWFDDDDPRRADLVLAMDRSNLRELVDMAPNAAAQQRIRLLRAFAGASDSTGSYLDVPDPYYGSDNDFDDALSIIEDAVEPVVAWVVQALAGPGAATRQ